MSHDGMWNNELLEEYCDNGIDNIINYFKELSLKTEYINKIYIK
jgi:uncharacterized Zn ribbon protein